MQSSKEKLQQQKERDSNTIHKLEEEKRKLREAAEKQVITPWK